MDNLIKTIKQLEKSPISKTIDTRIKEFQQLNQKDNKEWFSELCFCILTANSRAQTAINIQNELTPQGFLTKNQKTLSNCIKKNKHRFHNNKAKFIIEARKHKEIKDIITKEDKQDPREWLVKNIKGLGWKESSHFLRNTGHNNYAILDRHIINLMHEHNLIKDKPKTLTKKNYLKLEKLFNGLTEELNMTPAKLDLYMWYMKTGKVLK